MFREDGRADGQCFACGGPVPKDGCLGNMFYCSLGCIRAAQDHYAKPDKYLDTGDDDVETLPNWSFDE